MTPSVRGVERATVGAVLLVTASAAGALAGFALGVPALVVDLPGPTTIVAVGIVLMALAADVAFDRTGTPRPFSVGTQVPRAWARIFPLRLAAALYGARLGVGPLTVLNTWLWWGAAIVGAASGPATSTLVGASFGMARVMVMLFVARRAEQAMAASMAALRRRERLSAHAAGAGLLAVCVLVLAT